MSKILTDEEVIANIRYFTNTNGAISASRVVVLTDRFEQCLATLRSVQQERDNAQATVKSYQDSDVGMEIIKKQRIDIESLRSRVQELEDVILKNWALCQSYGYTCIFCKDNGENLSNFPHKPDCIVLTIKEPTNDRPH